MIFKSSPHYIKKDETGGACGNGQKCIRDFGGKTQRKRDNLEDLGVDGCQNEFNNRIRGCRLASSDVGYGQVVGLVIQGKKFRGFVK